MEQLSWTNVGIVLGVIVLFLVLKEGLPALARHWQRIGHSRPVESVSRSAPKVDAPTVRLTAPAVMSPRRSGRDLALRYQRFAQAEITRLTQENQNLKLENSQLKTKLAKRDDITAGQERGIDLFLEAERIKKPLTRTAASLLLGKDKTAALQLIRDREPVPDELAEMEPVPA